MNCCICLEKITDLNVRSDKCNCNIHYHKECYQSMIKNLNISCAICRMKTNNNHYSPPRDFNDWLFQTVFTLPAPVALFIWFFISWFFTIVIFPCLFLIEMNRNIESNIILNIKGLIILVPYYFFLCRFITGLII